MKNIDFALSGKSLGKFIKAIYDFKSITLLHGRNTISWTKKFELDEWYADNCSLMIDMKILFFTIKKVLIKEGIVQDGQVTVEVYNGKN